MNPISMTYEIARRHINDHRFLLSPTACDTLQAALRERSVPLFLGVVKSLEPAFPGLECTRLFMQLEAFFSKNASLPAVTDVDEVARHTFLSMERKCRNTNRRLAFLSEHPGPLGFWFREMCRLIELDISTLLGDHSAFLDKLPSLLRLTSGATNALPRSLASPPSKLRSSWTVSKRALPYFLAASRYFGYKPRKVEITEWNRVTFVPKNWKTSRTIACEPAGNLPFQLAFDSYVKDRLPLWGINLRDQSKNQRLALEGSVDDSLSTIDLKSASDTLAINAVALVLPPRWYAYLSDLRCRAYRLDKVESHYAKFSSMGNGATFGLETLVFASIVRVCGSRKYAVYGDDIIVERENTANVIRILSLFGFTVNRDKSYVDGPFRESCGVNAYQGVDVTPFYIREINERKPVMSHLVNGLVSISQPYGELAHFAKKLFIANKLVITPYSLDTTDGVHVSANQAYRWHLIRTVHGVAKRRSYVSKRRSGYAGDSLSLFLWFLQKNYEGRSEMVLGTSRNLLQKQHFQLKWTPWLPPCEGVPSHLYWWEDMLGPQRPLHVTRA